LILKGENNMTELEKALKEIEFLRNEILALKGIKAEPKKEEKKIYSFSKMTDKKLKECVTIHKEFNVKSKFDNWFDFDYKISNEEVEFLENIINLYGDFLSDYKEESLKALFVIPILNRVNFLLREYEIAGLYEETLTYEAEKFIFNGTTDFTFAKGLVEAEKPYFFIQEFKRNEENAFPRTQLLAELIAGLELNEWTTIKGAYIKGTIWNFVILEKLGEHKYQYFVSKDFLSTNIEDLKDIYKNLLYIKYEVIEMVKKGL
jgi:hypothetical protein